LRSFFGPSWAIFGSFCGCLGVSWNEFGPSWAPPCVWLFLLRDVICCVVYVFSPHLGTLRVVSSVRYVHYQGYVCLVRLYRCCDGRISRVCACVFLHMVEYEKGCHVHDHGPCYVR
jgi:hypothetical protein